MKKIVPFLLFLFLYQDIFSQNNEKYIMNQEIPENTEADFLNLEKRYSIDVLDYEKYEISLVTNITSDDSGNLYIVSLMDSKIFVFDSLGNFVKELGGRGQGPRELEKPFSLAVKYDKMFVHERYKGLKIWDSEGKYLDYIIFPPTKRNAVFFPYPGYYLVSYHEWDKDPMKTGKYILHYYYSKFDLKLNKITDINEIIIDAHKIMGFAPSEIIAFDSEDNIYTPVLPEIYKINKYNKDGEFLFSFGRKYESIKYSKKTRDRYYNKHTKGIKANNKMPYEYMIPVEIPKYPPVVRHIMVDGRDN
ncbi:MAG: 6-bladed beta-propeller, partial [bacterium]|nr:6-bladed beta-propeller [bacterium]